VIPINEQKYIHLKQKHDENNYAQYHKSNLNFNMWNGNDICNVNYVEKIVEDTVNQL